jgi:hypothetical protein
MSLQLQVYTEPGYDFVCYMASGDGNQFYGPCLSGNSGGWVSRTLNLAAVPAYGSLLGDSTVWVALIFDSDNIGHYANGGFVDDVLIRQCWYGVCPPTTREFRTPSTGALFAEAAVRTRP